MKKIVALSALAVLVLAAPAMAQTKDVSQIGVTFPPNFGLITGDFCSSPGTPIPDSSNVNTAQSVTSSDTITDLQVGLQISHTWVGDLKATVTHDSTTTAVVVMDRPGFTGTGFGCANNDIDVTLAASGTGPVESACAVGPPAISGTLTPNNPLSAFNGESLGGSWTLNVSDHAGGDVGVITTWCLTNIGGTTGGGTGGDTGGDTGGSTGGTGTPATNVWGVAILIALFLGVSMFYLRRRGVSNA